MMLSSSKQIALLLTVLSNTILSATCLNIVIAGGTGKIGQAVSSSLPASKHSITILARNTFLASAPSRVSSDFGWIGKSFLNAHPHVKLRDWDGGDLLDIVGCDWVGWQDDTIPKADVIINLVGGYTEQRVMATERLVRASLEDNIDALHICVSPLDDEVQTYSPGCVSDKIRRLKLCEDMVKQNCLNHACLRVEFYDLDNTCSKIIDAIENNSKSVN